MSASAQVTIGSRNPPSPFSLLDLDASKIQRGLHLPRLTETDRDALVNSGDEILAKGLMIFNTDTRCLEFWNGSQWISLCKGNTTPDRPEPNISIAPSNFCLSGHTCFDVAQSHSHTNFAGDIDNPLTRTFTLNGDDALDIRFFVTRNDHNAVASLNQNGNTVEVVFRSDINAVMTNSAGSFTILAQFTNGIDGERVQTSITARIQDNTCCMVRSTFCQGWLTFMCHNVGADPALSIDEQVNFPVTSNDARPNVSGYLFQWGRQADGHQQRNSSIFAEPGANPIPVSDASAFDAHGQIEEVHPAFGLFIRNNQSISATQGDWRLPQIDTLWNLSPEIGTIPVKNTANDPCPLGWRVPTIEEWRSIMNGDASEVADRTTTASGNTWTWQTRGYLVRPNGGVAGEPTLFLPATDWRFRNSGTRQNTNHNFGQYWSSTVYGVNAHTIHFIFGGFDVNMRTATRATGHAVRCVME